MLEEDAGYENADIERELYQLGLKDSPPQQPPRRITAHIFEDTPRCLSAPALHPEEPSPRVRLNTGSFKDQRPVRQFTHPFISVHSSLTDIPSRHHSILRTSSHPPPLPPRRIQRPLNPVLRPNPVTPFFRHLRPYPPIFPQPSTSKIAAPTDWQEDPGAVHYPRYVERQDFLSLPRGTQWDTYEKISPEDLERELIASVQAALRRVQEGIPESAIQFEHPDRDEEPPPPQPLASTLRDPPPSPVPPHDQESPPIPSVETGPYHPSSASGMPFGAPRLVGPVNASLLSREVGFIPIQESPSERFRRDRHHYHRHRPFRRDKSFLSRVLKRVFIKRGPFITTGFGFSIKGGRDIGVGVQVSRVEMGGPAWRAGLRPGDILLAANHTSFSDAAQAIELLKSSSEVTLTVIGPSELDPSAKGVQEYSWVSADGRPVSPPPEFNPRLHQHQVVWVDVEVRGSECLGLMIRGGSEYGLGIFVTGVDEASSADKAGLKVGDQLLEVNGESFLNVTHDTAVSILKYSRRLSVSVRRVGKMPHSCITYHSDVWNAQHSNLYSSENLEATLAMIEEKSRSVLERPAHNILKEVVSDYAAGRVPIEHLLTTARHLLDSPDKLSLLTELREVVRYEDQNKFDLAFYGGHHSSVPRHFPRDNDGRAGLLRPSEAHEKQAGSMSSSTEDMELKELFQSATSRENSLNLKSSYISSNADGSLSKDERNQSQCKQKSKDTENKSDVFVKESVFISSGSFLSRDFSSDETESLLKLMENELCVNNAKFFVKPKKMHSSEDLLTQAGRRRSYETSRPEAFLSSSYVAKHTSSACSSSFASCMKQDHLTSGRRSPSYDGKISRYNGRKAIMMKKDPYASSNVSRGTEDHRKKTFQSVRTSEFQTRPEIAPSATTRKDYLDIESLRKFQVVIKKTRPNLGIAIEGGVDTLQRIPRLINIAATGAAFEAGSLRVGQLILEVDGQRTEGLCHDEAARLIADCWTSRSRPEVEFLVAEKRFVYEPRSSSSSLASQR